MRAVILAVVLIAARAQAQECALSSRALSLSAVRVRPDGAPSFMLEVHEQPTRVTFRAGRPTKVAVDGALAFEGTVAHIDMRVTKPHATEDGMLYLREGSLLLGVRSDGNALVATLSMNPAECPGEPFEQVAKVRIPCTEADHRTAQSPEPEDRYAPWWRTWRGARRVVLYAEPRLSAAKRVLTLAPPRLVDHDTTGFRELERRGNWLRVKRRGRDVDLVGWLPAASLERASLGDFGSSGSGCMSEGYRGRDTRQREPTFEGVAEVQAGTVVYAHALRGAWATVPRPVRLRLSHVLSRPWARVLGVRGFSELPAFIPARAYQRVTE